jgi:hypothetical protein
MARNEGVWIDTRTGQVVTAEPEEGVLLAAPGAELTPDIEAAIEAAKAAAPAEPKGRARKETATAKAATETRG